MYKVPMSAPGEEEGPQQSPAPGDKDWGHSGLRGHGRRTGILQQSSNYRVILSAGTPVHSLGCFRSSPAKGLMRT